MLLIYTTKNNEKQMKSKRKKKAKCMDTVWFIRSLCTVYWNMVRFIVYIDLKDTHRHTITLCSMETNL